MRITRREFMKYCAISAGALGLTATDLARIEKAMATEATDGGTQVVWLNGAACTGCTVTLADTMYLASIQNLLVPWRTVEGAFGLPANTFPANGALDLNFMETLSSGVGAEAVNAAFATIGNGYPFALCLEGAIQTAHNGEFCEIWRVRKEHASLADGTLVWNSADRAALGVSNDTSQTIVLVSTVTGAAVPATAGYITLAPGSVLNVGDDLSVVAGSWVEKAADRAALAGLATPYAFDGENKVTAGGALAGVETVTLTGRVEVAIGNLFANTTLASNSIVYDAGDRALITGTYTFAPRAVGAVSLNQAVTLSGTVLLDVGSIIAAGSVLAVGSWVENAADQAALGVVNIDGDNKLSVASLTVATTTTLTGRVEAVAGSTLEAVDIDTATFEYDSNDEDRTFADEVLNFALASNCAVIIGVGTCASYGGIPGAKGNITEARGLITAKSSGGYAKVNNVGYWDWLLSEGKITKAQWTTLMSKTVCVPGCPPHPDWIVGTIVNFLALGEPPLMDKYHRPLDFYLEYQCTNCLWKVNDTNLAANDIDNNPQASKSGVTEGNSPLLYRYKYASSYEGCIGILGCKGRKTKADCSYRRWNTDTTGSAGVSWCVQTRGGCHGCTEPRFPDGWGKFFSYK